LIEQDEKSNEIIKLLARGKDVSRWLVNPKMWQIVTPIGVEIERYPAVFAHLSRWQKQLESRQDQGDHWWELRPCTYYDAFSGSKIIYPQILDDPSFAYDDSDLVTNQKCFIIANADKYLLGVLNSAPIWHMIYELSPSLLGGFTEPRKEFMLSLPIPDASAADRAAIEKLVNECLARKGSNCDEYEAEIDERVTELYGLTGDDE